MRNKIIIIPVMLILLSVTVFSASFYQPWQGVVTYNNGSKIYPGNISVNITQGSSLVYSEFFLNSLRLLPGNISGFDVVLGSSSSLNYDYGGNYTVCFSVNNISQGCLDWIPGFGMIGSEFIKNGSILARHVNFSLAGDGTGGWINSSTQTNTTLRVIVNQLNVTGNYTGGIDQGFKLYARNHAVNGDGYPETMELIGQSPTAKPYLSWTAWDNPLGTYTQVGWFGCHYNLTNGDVHSHCSIETLDNSTGTPNVNSHFSVSYNGSQTRAQIGFPGSDVVFLSGQKLYFGDDKQGYVVHNGTTGDVAIKANADVLIQAAQLDLNGSDIFGVDDIFSNTGQAVDLKADTDVRMFTNAQTSIGLDVGNEGSNVTLNGLSSSWTKFLDSVHLNKDLNVTGNVTLQKFLSCTIKTDGTGNFLCGVDNTGSSGTEQNVLNNITTLNQSLYWNQTGTALYPRDFDKKVGIGTTTPMQNLQVVGTANISQGTIYSGSLFNASFQIGGSTGYDFIFNESGRSYPRLIGVGALGANTLIDIPNGLYVSGSQFYVQSSSNLRGGVKNDLTHQAVQLLDELNVTGNFSVGATESRVPILMVNNDSAKIGVNELVPPAALTVLAPYGSIGQVLVNSSGAVNSYITINSPNGNEAGIQFGNGGGLAWYAYRPAGTNDLDFYRLRSVLRLTDKGNVAVNATSSGNATMNVNGTMTIANGHLFIYYDESTGMVILEGK